MVLRVADQQSLYPDGQHTLAFYIKCVPPVGLLLAFTLEATDSSPAAVHNQLLHVED